MPAKSSVLVDENTQIKALMTNQAFDLAESVLGLVRTVADYQRVFTVTESDVMRCIERDGLPEGACKTAPGAGENLYCHAEEGKWIVYRMERGRRYDSQGPFESSTDAFRALVRLKLYYSGTGIDFSLAPEHAERGNGGFPVVKFSTPGHQSAKQPVRNETRNAIWPWRCCGILMALVSLGTMLFVLRYLSHSGVPEATGSRTGNLGTLILLSLPWVGLGLGLTVFYSNRHPRDISAWFNQQSWPHRIAWSVIILLTIVGSTTLVLLLE